MSTSSVSSATTSSSGPQLKGNLGTMGLLFSMLAFQVPLISVGAYSGFVIGYGLDVVGYFDPSRLGFALLWGMAGYIGFEAIEVFRSEARDPDKTVPRATYLTVICLGCFLALATWAYLVAFGTKGAIATADTPLPGFLSSLQQYTGIILRDTANVLMASSGFALVLASQNISSRYLFTLARDRVFPHALSAVDPRHKAPTRAAATIAIVVLAGILLSVILSVDTTLLYTSLAGIAIWGILFLMTVAGIAIIVFFRRNAGLERSVWKSVIAPAVGTIGMAVTVVLATVNRAELFGGDRTLATICILVILAVGLGGALYAWWLRSHRPDVYDHLSDTD